MNKEKKQHVVVLEDSPESLDIELSDLYATNSKYTPEEKIEVVMCYFLTGKSNYAAKMAKEHRGINVKPDLIRYWKSKALWWDDVYGQCKKLKNEELDTACTNLIHSNLEQIADRVAKGDYRLNTKTGEQIRVPMNGRDLVIVMGTIFDKRQLVRGEATSRTDKVSESDRLKKLEDKFLEMAGMQKEWNAKPVLEIDE